jgi:intracellular sulfur oxidation DsrE/DsrF family protein
MDTKYFAALCFMTLLLPAAGQVCAADAVAAGQAATQNRLVFQAGEDGSRTWNAILSNIENVRQELGRVDVAVVAIGPGLGMLKADALTANRVQDAMKAGVRFVACGNSMQALHLTKDDMIDGIDYARAGYVEVMRLQQQGWAYIRP